MLNLDDIHNNNFININQTFTVAYDKLVISVKYKRDTV